MDTLNGNTQNTQLWKINKNSNSFESDEKLVVDISLEDACQLIRNSFEAAAEREITIGDGIELCIITSNGIQIDYHKLPFH